MLAYCDHNRAALSGSGASGLINKLPPLSHAAPARPTCAASTAMARVRLWLASFVALAVAGLVGVAQADEAVSDDLVKAGYLFKFTPFVMWPGQAFESPTSPFNLCVTGDGGFDALVDSEVRGRKVGDHPIAVVRLRAVTRGAPCHLLFLGRSRVQSPQEMIEAVAGRPVLTVADQGLSAPGAMIQFVMDEGRTRFEIRPQPAEAVGLALSSKLLSLSAHRGAGR